MTFASSAFCDAFFSPAIHHIDRHSSARLVFSALFLYAVPFQSGMFFTRPTSHQRTINNSGCNEIMIRAPNTDRQKRRETDNQVETKSSTSRQINRDEPSPTVPEVRTDSSVKRVYNAERRRTGNRIHIVDDADTHCQYRSSRPMLTNALKIIINRQ